jgi:phosphoribosylpyrophosphate synthetase
VFAVGAGRRLLLDDGARLDVVVAATHCLFVGDAVKRLASLPVRRLVATDSLAVDEDLALPVEVSSIARLLATAIDEPIDELLATA